MKIYHYSSIENLALILKNRTLRFSCAQNLNDPEEAVTTDFRNSLQKHTFVSCWSQNSEESIPMWKIYADNGHGVRLESNTDYIHFIGKETNINGTDIVVQNVSSPKSHKKNFILLRQRKHAEDCHYFRVEYSDEEKHFVTDASDDKIKRFQFNMEKAFATKKKHWSFENEIRFILLGVYCEDKYQSNNWQYHFNQIHAKKPFSSEYVDLILQQDFFDNLSITCSPLMTKSERIITESLVEVFNKKRIDFINESLIKMQE